MALFTCWVQSSPRFEMVVIHEFIHMWHACGYTTLFPTKRPCTYMRYCDSFVACVLDERKSTRKDPPWKVTKTRPFLTTCYGYPSTTEVPPCCQAATKKLTFSTTSVLLLLNVPLSLSRGTVFRRQKNPRREYRPKIAGILFVCNEPEGKYYTEPEGKYYTVTNSRISTEEDIEVKVCELKLTLCPV